MLTRRPVLILGTTLLVSLVSVVAVADEVVVFPDPNLDAAIRLELGKPTGNIYASELLTLLSVSVDDVSDLTGIEYCRNLLTLGIDGHVVDISPLAHLTKLTSLHIDWGEIADLGPVEGLTNLKDLVLQHDQITDISALSGLTELQSLILMFNQIIDISPLAGLTQLECLELDNNQISDLSPLCNLTKLVHLNLYDNQIVDIGPVANLPLLEHLSVANNQVVDIGPLAGRSRLSWLTLSNNRISDLNPLGSLAALSDVYLDGNLIRDVSALLTLPYSLAELFYVDLRRNPLGRPALCTDIPILLGRNNTVLHDGTCYDDNTFPLLEEEGNTMAAAQGAALGLPTTYGEWDIEGWPETPCGDGIPDLWQLSLFADVYYNDHHRLHQSLIAAYDTNLGAMTGENPSAASMWSISVIGLSTEMRDTICAILSLNPDNYHVYQNSGKAIDEPFSATGDCDGDGISNLDEYLSVIARGGDIEDFVMEAGENNPFWDGNPDLPFMSTAGFALLMVLLTSGGIYHALHLRPQ